MKNGGPLEKFSFLKKLSKNSQKIQGNRSRRADSKNVRCQWHRTNIVEISGEKLEFFEILKNRDISMGDSGKTVRVIEETMPELTSAARNLQENAFSLV